MSVWVIILLILLGILLFLVEFLLVPGITVAGIAGSILVIGGVILAYHFHGPVTGNFVLLGTAGGSFLSIYLALKSRTWKNVMLHSEINSRVDLVRSEEGKVKAGDVGETITRLNPMGKVMVNGEAYEGRAIDSYIDPKTEVEIIKVERNRLIVKPKNN